ncbi:MAG: hypothetical protein ACUVUR_03240 [bacterium]
MFRLKLFLLLSALMRTVNATEWDSIIRLTDNNRAQVLGLSYQKSVAVDHDGNVWVFWQDQRTSPSQLWFRRFDRASRMWLPESQLTRLPAPANPPSAVCDQSGNVHLFWHIESELYRGIWYKKYDRAQTRWLAETLLVPGVLGYLRKYPVVATQLGGNVVHIVWYGNPDSGGFYQVFHKEYQPGSGWLPYEPVSYTSCPHEAASIAADSSDDLCVVWLGQDLGGQFNQVFCRCRIGGLWQDVELVSDLPGGLAQYAPGVSCGTNGNWHIVWEGTASGQLYRQIYHRLCTPVGLSEIFTVSRTINYQQGTPSASCRGKECYIVWRGRTQTTPDRYQLRYAFRDKNGLWSLPEELTNINSGDVDRPAIVSDSAFGLHIAFQIDSGGNLDVYYLAGQIASSGIIEPDCRLPVSDKGWIVSNLSSARIYNPLGEAAGNRISSPASGIYLIETRDHGHRRFQKIILLRGKR